MATRDTYEVQTWENAPQETSPLSAARFNHIEQGIKDASDNRALREIYGDNAISLWRKYGTNVGSYSSAIGRDNEASANYSSADGRDNKVSGENSHVGGSDNVVSGKNSSADGSNNNVSGQRSHAGGSFNEVSGWDSDAEGNSNEVSGWQSHVEGMRNKVSGNKSHGEGIGTITSGDAQHVSGKYNVEDSDGIYASIVGGGSEDTYEGETEISHRKNIYTLDWLGNAVYAGDVTNGQGISLNSLKSDIDNMEIIAEGGAIAKVFDTKDELDAWLLIDGNAETLTVGQNIYIVETDTPDYWWDGTGLQVLETDAVEIESMSYAETMEVLNA